MVDTGESQLSSELRQGRGGYSDSRRLVVIQTGRFGSETANSASFSLTTASWRIAELIQGQDQRALIAVPGQERNNSRKEKPRTAAGQSLRNYKARQLLKLKCTFCDFLESELTCFDLFICQIIDVKSD